MTITAHPPASTRAPMDSLRRTALLAGTFYLITFLASIPAALVFLPTVLDHPDFILGTGSENAVLWGAVLEVVTALAGVAAAVVLFPVVKRQSEAAALGFVTTRLLEAAMILVGVVSLLAVVTLRQDLGQAAGTDTAALVTTGQALVAIRDWTFLFGPGLMAALNAMLLGSIMFRSGLVPRVIPTVGLIGAPILLVSVLGTLLGYHDQLSPTAAVAVLPIATWEISLGIWLVVKGFKPSPITARS